MLTSTLYLVNDATAQGNRRPLAPRAVQTAEFVAVTLDISSQVEYRKDLENSKGHSINFCETPQFQNAAKVAKFTSDVSGQVHPQLDFKCLKNC